MKACRVGRSVGAVLTLVCVAGGPAAAGVSVEADQPRAFGYTVGDRVERHVTLRASRGLVLDVDTLPAVGQHGKALELRELQRRVFSDADGGQRHELRFVYQVFLAPVAVRTLEMPPVVLGFRADPAQKGVRGEDVRIDAWPLTVSPMVPVDVSPRRGLGELQADAPPPPIDTAPARQRLLALAVVAALLVAYLLAVYALLPWMGRTRRPFERAWRALRDDPLPVTPTQQHAALRQVHAALNQAAGRVLFAGGVDDFIAEQPAFAPLRSELQAFFMRSQQAFFAQAANPAGPGAGAGAGAGASLGPWLRAFCRRCRDVERGTA